ncbi:MAG: sulfatase-like hydrolase/transferase [Flavobacteriales bacterium]|nr:sulfatase-like hydrolase/transferase [Flavobacteriales bacterium]MBP9079301.1 sulfatase-like hydrolase/transferase [Flavobacteriales bacterium]
MPNLRPLRIWLLRMGAVALIFSLQRVLFALLNHEAFPAPPLLAFVGGIRFDLFAVAWLFMPWTLLTLAVEKPGVIMAKVQKGLFHLACTIGFLLNSIDIAYFGFTLKRSTSDLLGIATGGDDLASLLPVFMVDYWYIVLIFLGSMAVAIAGFLWTGRHDGQERAKPWWLWRLIMAALTLVACRGGLQYIPLGVLNASQYAAPAYMPVVLNTPFTVMTSMGKAQLEEKAYMDQPEADRLWPVVHRYGDTTLIPHRPNVVVIVLESFGAAYSAKLNGGESCMPFLDSLMGQGLWYSRAYANGRRSIDGIPAVLASLPKMMPEAFIESPYAQQPFTALPGLLAAEGYGTSFFHGGHNGTMGFDVFARSAGFQRYVGRDQYPDPKDDDGVWGIRDRPFLQFFAQEMNKEPQPFMSCLFTLSSHHPYRLPPEEARLFAGGDLPILPTLRYADDALRQFFATAQTLPWYANTLFVITADHTADLLRQGEVSGSAYDHWIPLFYFMPATIRPERADRITQQIDILPTVLDLIGYPKPFFAFGSSSLRHERLPAAVGESNATWLLVGDSCQIRSDGEQVLWSTGLLRPQATACTDSAALLPTLQAAIQQYNNNVLRHSLSARYP